MWCRSSCRSRPTLLRRRRTRWAPRAATRMTPPRPSRRSSGVEARGRSRRASGDPETELAPGEAEDLQSGRERRADPLCDAQRTNGDGDGLWRNADNIMLGARTRLFSHCRRPSDMREGHAVWPRGEACVCNEVQHCQVRAWWTVKRPCHRQDARAHRGVRDETRREVMFKHPGSEWAQ